MEEAGKLCGKLELGGMVGPGVGRGGGMRLHPLQAPYTRCPVHLVSVRRVPPEHLPCFSCCLLGFVRVISLRGKLSHFPLTAAPGTRSALETGQEGCDGEKRGGWMFPRLSSVGLGPEHRGRGDPGQ